LPFLLAGGTPNGAVEIRIGLEGDRLVEVEVPWSRELPAGIELSVPPGRRTAVPIGAFALVDALAATVRRGSVLLIDYGSMDGPTGGAHGYRGQRGTSDILSRPGATDVTAGVDFAMVGAYARALGLDVLGAVSQAGALDALGFGRWSATMRERQTMLQSAGRGADAVRVWETRSRASLLVDPSSYGSLWWLVLATPGFARPGWLDRALEDRPTAD
jgi:hypothetical protein